MNFSLETLPPSISVTSLRNSLPPVIRCNESKNRLGHPLVAPCNLFGLTSPPTTPPSVSASSSSSTISPSTSPPTPPVVFIKHHSSLLTSSSPVTLPPPPPPPLNSQDQSSHSSSEDAVSDAVPTNHHQSLGSSSCIIVPPHRPHHHHHHHHHPHHHEIFPTQSSGSQLVTRFQDIGQNFFNLNKNYTLKPEYWPCNPHFGNPTFPPTTITTTATNFPPSPLPESCALRTVKESSSPSSLSSSMPVSTCTKIDQQHQHNNRASSNRTFSGLCCSNNVTTLSIGGFANSPSSTSSSNSTVNNGRTPVKQSKPRRRVATLAQRRAANIRERRRMYHLNTAFDKLRKKVPTFAYEKRLSRIETLRLAVMYITFMTDILR
ncbi:uncharacterized protein LOC141853800 [Brevipalpus obovatus]|uniref:uncharacterized protein LOC141853800 n=1 Tax=Brevipalpus obovatus TaxID=246614 RepID=UPI003D9DF825